MSKKVVTLSLILFIIGFSTLFSGKKDQRDLWMRIAIESNPNVKIQLLDEYLDKYRKNAKKDKVSVNFNLHYAITAYQVKRYDDALAFGDKVLTEEDVEDTNKIKLYLCMADVYLTGKNDLDKAHEYTEKVLGLAEKMSRLMHGNTGQLTTLYSLPAYKLQLSILGKREKNVDNTKKLIEKAIQIYNTRKSKRAADTILAMAVRLYKLDENEIDEAIRGVETIAKDITDNTKYFEILALWYNKKGDKEKTVAYLKASYNVKADARIAYNLGRLLQKSDIDEAIKYLAEAFHMKDEKYSENANKLLQHLYYNVKTKGQSKEEQDAGFREIMDAAKTRLGIEET
jgi:tetratricopeptide (TPR) repeat protein